MNKQGDEKEDISHENDDILIFEPEDSQSDQQKTETQGTEPPWKILIVDDEVDVHQITKLALKDFQFQNRAIRLISAYSAKEAIKILQENSDIALVLLDVVMETEQSGIEVIKYIREVLGNLFIRIVLRTGQPGQAPEEIIIREYDINDYKNKTELTYRKLISVIITALRTFELLIKLEKTLEDNKNLYQKLNEYSTNLELKVIERTQKLDCKNQQLEREISKRHKVEAALRKTNQRLKYLTLIDGLTQISNRRHFDQYLEREWRRMQREQNFLSLILCDVDYFKLYNDTYGHQVGDECLRNVANAIKSCAKRSTDLIARYGGEEFAVILSVTPSEGARIVAENIRLVVKKLKIVHAASQASKYVSISCGISTIIPTQAFTPNILTATADKALYEAKENGRDCLVLKTINL